MYVPDNFMVSVIEIISFENDQKSLLFLKKMIHQVKKCNMTFFHICKKQEQKIIWFFIPK